MSPRPITNVCASSRIVERRSGTCTQRSSEGSGDDRIRNAVPNDVGGLWRERGPFPVLLNGRRDGEWRRHFATIPAETVALPSTSPRPLHWNTAESRRAAIEEWRLALRSTLAADSD